MLKIMGILIVATLVFCGGLVVGTKIAKPVAQAEHVAQVASNVAAVVTATKDGLDPAVTKQACEQLAAAGLKTKMANFRDKVAEKKAEAHDFAAMMRSRSSMGRE